MIVFLFVILSFSMAFVIYKSIRNPTLWNKEMKKIAFAILSVVFVFDSNVSSEMLLLHNKVHC